MLFSQGTDSRYTNAEIDAMFKELKKKEYNGTTYQIIDYGYDGAYYPSAGGGKYHLTLLGSDGITRTFRWKDTH